MGVNLSNVNSQLAGQIPVSNAMSNFYAGQGGALGGQLKNLYEGGKEGYNALSNWWNAPNPAQAGGQVYGPTSIEGSGGIDWGSASIPTFEGAEIAGAF